MGRHCVLAGASAVAHLGCPIVHRRLEAMSVGHCGNGWVDYRGCNLLNCFKAPKFVAYTRARAHTRSTYRELGLNPHREKPAFEVIFSEI